MHWDPTYNATHAGLSCNPGTPPEGPFGKFGDFNCDPPWQLIESAFEFMAAKRSEVDFVIWTGLVDVFLYHYVLYEPNYFFRDDTPHIWDDDVLNKDWVLDIMTNQTNILNETFPNTAIFSAIGNHDWSPKNQLPPNGDPFYDQIYDLWKDWIPQGEEERFRKGYLGLETCIIQFQLFLRFILCKVPIG